jgi:leucyl aminopeptidase
MEGLLAVGRAGSTPPALICLEYRSARSKNKPVLLVGKAVTFDTGGISIKPSAGMEYMKYDKCGGMSVIGAMHAIAQLQLSINVVGLVGAAENMVGTQAYRPSDILKMYNGVTVEVTNTDAEGRLVLADALAYGCERYKPKFVIDLATLTGGVVVALGPYCAGMFCNDGSLREHLLKAGDITEERLWHLPLWHEHRKQLKGTHGDIVNSAGREAHPIQGAAFLSHFIDSDGPTTMPISRV